jgi:PAS domain S-box-containing protein
MTRSRATPFLVRAIGWSFDHPLPRPVRYLAAGLLIVLVAVIRATFITSLVPWLLFIPAILVSALILGEAVGIFASLLSALLAALTIGSTAQPWFLSAAQWAGSAVFLAVTIGMAHVAGELRAAFRRARQSNIDLHERESFLSSVLASSTDCIKVLDMDGKLTFMSEGGMKVMEVDDFAKVDGCAWPDFWHDSGNVEACAAIKCACEGQASHFVAKADTLRGNSRWWDVSVSPIRGADGKPSRILAVSRDTTELTAAQEQQRLLNGELGHRLKNILSLVQAIANQTFRKSDSLEEANALFSSRLAALGKATDVLTSTAWQSATLHDVIRAGLASIDGVRDRIEIAGPPIRLDAQLALALTLALHELATNACKYGALSNDSGSVALDWAIVPVENGGDARFMFRWLEKNGPMVTPPVRTGFGSKMIERSLRSYFRGETSLDFDPAGVVFTIDAPLPATAAILG